MNHISHAVSREAIYRHAHLKNHGCWVCIHVQVKAVLPWQSRPSLGTVHSACAFDLLRAFLAVMVFLQSNVALQGVQSKRSNNKKDSLTKPGKKTCLGAIPKNTFACTPGCESSEPSILVGLSFKTIGVQNLALRKKIPVMNQKGGDTFFWVGTVC